MRSRGLRDVVEISQRHIVHEFQRLEFFVAAASPDSHRDAGISLAFLEDRPTGAVKPFPAEPVRVATSTDEKTKAIDLDPLANTHGHDEIAAEGDGHRPGVVAGPSHRFHENVML